MPAISVVVATRERPHRLAALLDSLRTQTLAGDFEVLVVDDGSRDGTPELLARERARGDLDLTVISRAGRGGAAAARNEGWRAARAPVVAFTDDDCEAAEEWLEAGLAACRQAPGAVVQGRTEPNPAELDSVGAFSRTIEVRGPNPYFHTCNIFYPRDVLERFGGFDQERFRGAGGEDADLAWRAIEHGVETRFAHEAVVHHAVENLGPRGHLRVALRWSDPMAMFRRGGLRRSTLVLGLFWKATHLTLPVALLALTAAPRRPALAALAVPYARTVAHRMRVARSANPLLVPYFVLHDALEIGAAVRGALRHRVLVV